MLDTNQACRGVSDVELELQSSLQVESVGAHLVVMADLDKCCGARQGLTRCMLVACGPR